MKPTREQVQEEIKKLQEMKPKVQRTTLFGDNNHAAIDADIDVLKHDLSTDDIYDAYEDMHVADSALYARAWLDGDEDEPPSGPECWGGLVREKKRKEYDEEN